MKKNTRRLCARFLAALLLLSAVFSQIPPVTAAAATDLEEAIKSAPMDKSDEIAISNAIKAINRANLTGAEADIAYAKSLISALSPINRLRLYIRLSNQYYLNNYKIEGFKFFDAKKYIAANDDVRKAALKERPDDIEGYALQHYLLHGVYEGRSSQTSFDPVVAVIEPDKQEKKDAEDAPNGDFIVDNGEFDGDDDYDKDDDDEDSDSDSIPGGASQDREPIFINNQSMQILPYKLYTDPGDYDSYSFMTYNPFEDINNYKLLEVRFLRENYERAKELSQEKKYTLMMYFCGTDLERSEKNRSLSGEIVRMLQADMSNVNVILCVGGTTEYGNRLMNEDSMEFNTYRASGLRSGIYYLNPDGLDEDIRDRLKDVVVSWGEPILELSDQSSDIIYSQGLKFDDIITPESLIQLVSTSAVDISDPSYLAGFMNFCTDLFPADNYGLTLSDHGGGLEGGVIYTDSLTDGDREEFQENYISVYELESALGSTDLYLKSGVSPDGKLGVIFYNACLMGSTAQAYTTKNYYRYMIASEETSAGHTPYNLIITGLSNDVAAGKSDRDIAVNFTKAYESFPETHHGHSDFLVGSVATFSSEDMEEMRDCINDLAREFSEVLGTDNYSDNFKQDVFMAIRKASLSCYPTHDAESYYYNDTYQYETDYVDIGEMLNFVSDNLKRLDDDDYSEKDSQELTKLLSVLDFTLNSGFMTYLSIYNKEMGGIYKESTDGPIPLNYEMDTDDALWTDVRVRTEDNKEYLYGSSIYMPLKKKLSEYKESKYYQYYKGSELNDYVEFIEDYLAYYNDSDGYAKKMDALSDEIYKKDIYSKLITQYKTDYGSVVREYMSGDNDKRDFISFKVADTYEEAGLDTPENSTGNPMLDILETQSSILIAAVHKERFDAVKDGENGAVEVDMVCAEVPVPPFCFALESNTISFDISDARNSIIEGMIIEGKTWDSKESVGEEDWQFVLSSYLDKGSSLKKKAMQVLFPDDYEDVKTVTVTGSSVTKNNDSEDYSYKDDTILVFKATDDNEYDYCGSLSSQDVDDETTFTRIDDVVAVAAYHWVIKEEKDDEGNVVNYSQKMLEAIDGFSEGYFYIGSDDDKLVLKTDVNIAETVQKGSYTGYNADATAYYIDPCGNGDSYSQIGYVEDTAKHESTTTNLGNGPMAVIDMANVNESDLDSIGEFFYKPDEWSDTDTADDNYEEQPPINLGSSEEEAKEPEEIAQEPAEETEAPVETGAVPYEIEAVDADGNTYSYISYTLENDDGEN